MCWRPRVLRRRRKQRFPQTNFRPQLRNNSVVAPKAHSVNSPSKLRTLLSRMSVKKATALQLDCDSVAATASNLK